MEAVIVKDIQVVRGRRVLLDFQLAAIYQIETKRLNQQVKRNSDRFPEDFMFQLTEEEWAALRLQNATSKGGRRYLPHAFTEHGAVMLASVLNSEVAIKASIFVVRAFVQIREYLSTHKELAEKIEKLEAKYDHQFAIVFDAIKKLIHEKNEPRPQIGFIPRRDLSG
ncbi:MAG TPA: ORF6N domain-containing protein [Catalimonadaceae bacterium]|nr:ORF6N domain-containing protein [Catalimonadaceae bacterium]HPI12201.1 ORF6N domain-containing protein [Catalimonadaceae bacterium]